MSKILVVDDSQMMRVYLRRCLEKHGHEVTDWMPESPMEVTEKVKDLQPDLVITDYQMPACNGSTLARMVFKADLGTPLIVLTAFKEPDMESTLAKFGVRQVYTKPISPEGLLQAVDSVLNKI